MSDEEIHQLIFNEFEAKTLGVTEQYLEIHQPVFENGLLKIDRIDRECADIVVAYLPVVNEYFSFAVYIDIREKTISNIGTESRNTVSLIVLSENLTAAEMQSVTKINADRAWNKGDLIPKSKMRYKLNGLEFLPNPEPDAVEDKLRKLLSYLKTDKAGILELGKNTETYILATMDFHRGNQLLGQAWLNSENIAALNELQLEIKFDIAAWGNLFK